MPREADRTSRVTGEFAPARRLVVDTEPEDLGATVIIDDHPRDSGSVAIPIGVGEHTVCFEAVSGYLTPDCQDVEVEASEERLVRATYAVVDGPTEPQPTEPTEPIDEDEEPLGDDGLGTVMATSRSTPGRSTAGR